VHTTQRHNIDVTHTYPLFPMRETFDYTFSKRMYCLSFYTNYSWTINHCAPCGS